MSSDDDEQSPAMDDNPTISYQIPRNKQINEPRKKRTLLEFARKHPILSVLLATLVLIALLLIIVLPATLVKKKEERPVKPMCPDGKSQPRIDCLPDRNKLMMSSANLEDTCRSRACCWSSSPEQGGPNCAFPYNYGFRNFKVKEKTLSSQWIELIRMNSPQSFTRSDIANLETRIEMQTDDRLRIRIFPRRNFKNKIQRWEVPSGVMNENLFQPNYRVEMSDLPFSLKVYRNSTNQKIFDTSSSSLIFSDQFIQITTQLSSPNVFGIGENSKQNILHDMNFKTWPLFASQNHPNTANEKPNLYSQFPMYLNIEPDGKSHVVVFYNSNPSEFYLTPFPSLTYRAIGGIFDIYIFTGPTPVQALEQFQQAFGLPKLPPFWSLGLQVSAKKYQNTTSLRQFIDKFKSSKLPFDSVLIGTEHMQNNTMFTVSEHFRNLNTIVDSLRSEHRAAILQLLPVVGNATQNYPFSLGVSKEKYWILENFFSSGVTGKLLGLTVIYPDFTLEKTREWWTDALQRFVVTDQMIKFDGIFMDYLTPVNENLNKTCSNNKWNFPAYVPDAIMGPLYNYTLCMDSRYQISKHYNIHGLYSHFITETTAKALDTLIHNRTLLMTRHAFIGTNRFATKYLGEYDSQWDDLRASIIATMEMSMFGFPVSGGDICGYNGQQFDSELCENWIKAAAMSPMMKLVTDSDAIDDERLASFMSPEIFEVLNSTLYLRYQLMPYFYTQLFKSTKYGTIPIRALAFEFPEDQRTFRINNQWLWGDKLMVSVGTSPGGLTQIYLPKGEWFDYYKGFHRVSQGEYVNVQVRRNETSLYVKGGSVIFKEDCLLTVTESKNTFIDVIIALNETDNFTAQGDLYMDDHTKKETERKENYHRLIDFKIYRNESDGIIEVKRKSGRYLTRLSYRDLIIYGLRSKPSRITVNENSQAIDGAKATWDETNLVYYVNLQTEVKKKVLLDNEYLSFRWTGGFESTVKNGNQNQNQNNNQFNPTNNQIPPIFF